MRGAVAGAFIVAMAFLAGYAAIRRSGLAVCALLMVAGAAALEFSWLGFFSGLPADGEVMLQALFAAAAIVFLSATVGAARYNAVLGGVMFTLALVLGGMGVINFFDRIDLAPLMRLALFGVGGFAIILAGLQAFRGDAGARLVLPGIALAAAAPVIAAVGGGSAATIFASHGLFTLGILGASIVALTDGGAVRAAIAKPTESFGFEGAESASWPRREHDASQEQSEIVLDSQIARVLDYSGVGIWDWSPKAIDQTESLAGLLGGDANAPFTPDALRAILHEEDAARFDAEVLSPVDGPFDVNMRLADGRVVRMRGARAADEESGEVERLVVFIENAPAALDAGVNGVDEASLRSATEAAIVPTASSQMTAKFSQALENGDIIAAFQPIVSLNNGHVAGYEALARWRDQEDGADEGPEKFVQAAERAGQGGALAAAMLDQAAAFLAHVRAEEKRKDLFVAMNVSWGQISEEGFHEAVRDAVSKYDLPKNALVLELTEADAISDGALASSVFKHLKDAGVALAFDDFGAGFTCLSNLRKFDFDYLKIDKSFSGDVDSDNVSSKIVASLASLGKDLGLKVILEGVESKGAAQKAKQLGCAYAQGYQFGKPVTFEAAPAPEETLEEAPQETAAELATEAPAVQAEAEAAPTAQSEPEDAAVADKLRQLAGKAAADEAGTDRAAQDEISQEEPVLDAGEAADIASADAAELQDGPVPTGEDAGAIEAGEETAAALAETGAPSEQAAFDSEEEPALVGADNDAGSGAGSSDAANDEAAFAAEEESLGRKHRRWRFWGGAQDLR